MSFRPYFIFDTSIPISTRFFMTLLELSEILLTTKQKDLKPAGLAIPLSRERRGGRLLGGRVFLHVIVR